MVSLFTDYQDLAAKVDLSSGSAVALGNFDGIHRGHQKILSTAIEEAKRQHLVSIIFTFHPHPSKILRPADSWPKMILTEAEKMELLSQLGFDLILNQNFSREFSMIVGRDFSESILAKSLNSKVICVGENFRFGNRAEGTISLLRESKSFVVPKIEAVQQGTEILSSSIIRTQIQLGKIAEANEGLGRRYFVSGIVKHGDGRGKVMGFPTANIETQKECLPAVGVYSGYLEFEGQLYLAAINCGMRPTFNASSFQIEAHLIDQKIDLYGESVRLHFVNRIRDEMKFSGVEALKAQIRLDLEVIRGQVN